MNFNLVDKYNKNWKYIFSYSRCAAGLLKLHLKKNEGQKANAAAIKEV